jgi:hypothetical protein
MLVDLDVRRVADTEQLEHLTGFGVAPRDPLGVQNLAVNDDVEHTLRPRDKAKLGNDVLVVVQQIVRGAHGAL